MIKKINVSYCPKNNNIICYHKTICHFQKKFIKNHGSFLALFIGLDFMPSIVMVGYDY